MKLNATTNNPEFLVTHPLDDVQEKKLDIQKLGPMRMTRVVRVSLLALRAYLILMSLLVLYHVVDLAARSASARP